MLSFPPAVRIWLALAPADLRKGFDALAELVRQHLRDDPLSGHVFVFRNRRGDRVKLLYWDTDGYVIVYNWCLAKLRVLVGETGLVYTIGAILSRREVLPWPAS